MFYVSSLCVAFLTVAVFPPVPVNVPDNLVDLNQYYHEQPYKVYLLNVPYQVEPSNYIFS